MTDKPIMNLTYFVYPALTHPHGFLPHDKRAQACWYFYTLAENARQQIGDSTEDQFGLLEGHLWMDKRYEEQALAVAMLYQLDSPSEFAKFWGFVEQQAQSMGYPAPKEEYKRIMRGRIVM